MRARPVDFVGALHQARDAGAQVFLQVGAGGMLTGFARATLGRDLPDRQFGLRSRTTPAMGIVHGLCTLAALGILVDFESLYDGEGSPGRKPARNAPGAGGLLADQRRPAASRRVHSLRLCQPQTARFPRSPSCGDHDCVGRGHRIGRHTADISLATLFTKQAEVLRAHAEIHRHPESGCCSGKRSPVHRSNRSACKPVMQEAPPRRRRLRPRPPRRLHRPRRNQRRRSEALSRSNRTGRRGKRGSHAGL